MSQGDDARREDRLAGPGGGELDRAVRQDLDRILVEGLLARQDASAELARAIDETVRAPLVVAEIAGVLDRLESPVFPELAGMLAGPEAAGLQMEPNLLSELLREGVQGQVIMQRGLVFLKHRRYAEAVEWWTLNRQPLDPATSRLHLLLLVMEAMTHILAGDAVRAAAVQNHVRSHPLFRPGNAGPGLSRADR